jgi:hypothetical protein
MKNTEQWKRQNGQKYWVVLGRRKPTDEWKGMAETDEGRLCFPAHGTATLFPNKLRPYGAIGRSHKTHKAWEFKTVAVQADPVLIFRGPTP